MRRICSRHIILVLTLVIMTISGTFSAVYADDGIPESSVPRKTAGAAVASMKVGGKKLFSYGQMRQKGKFRRGSGCGYCAIASLIGLVRNKKIMPVTIAKLNGDKPRESYQGAASALKSYGINYVYVKSYGSRGKTLGLILQCLQEHRPVFVTVNMKWSTYAVHNVLLVGFTDKGRVLVCDSGRDRAWAGSMQRFKIVKWGEIAPYICKIGDRSRKVYASAGKGESKKKIPWSNKGFITTQEPAF